MRVIKSILLVLLLLLLWLLFCFCLFVLFGVSLLLLLFFEGLFVLFCFVVCVWGGGMHHTFIVIPSICFLESRIYSILCIIITM